MREAREQVVLVKDVCRRCYITNWADTPTQSSLEEEFESYWKQSYVECMVIINYRKVAQTTMIYHNPPNCCRFKLEQGVMNQGDTDGDSSSRTQ